MRLLKQAAFFAALMFSAFIVLNPALAFAQDAVATVTAEPTLIQQLVAAVLPAVGLVLSAFLAYVANEIRKRTGLDIEARHREALQSALMNGIMYALTKSGWVQGQPVEPVLTVARGYVEQSVPDALKSFGIDTATNLGRAALDRLLTPKLPVPAGMIMPNGDVLIGK